MKFSTNYSDVLNAIEAIDPLAYGRSRNFIDGSVTYLSPYISRGVISTKLVFEKIKERKLSYHSTEKLFQELAWRDYFQRVWQNIGEHINEDIKREQSNVSNHQLSSAIINGQTKIDGIDQSIHSLYETGYMHNHCRMYTAFLACNVAQSHWKIPAKWMYYHLLDADWASNACSWQWVAGSFSNKKYITNQENISKYTLSNQKKSYLNLDYSLIENIEIPEELLATQLPALEIHLPEKVKISINNQLPTFIYNFYNLDPLWHQTEIGNRILLIEPSHFKSYPVSKKSIDFMLELSKNIDGIQIYVGEFKELINEFKIENIFFKEHPFSKHFFGNMEQRDWMFPEVQGNFNSFFAFWKKCEKHLVTS
jgi:deoxyribodipyrimidine photo-lyase